MEKLYALDVRGKKKDWSFQIQADPKYIAEWRNDGLIVEEITNIIPKWWVDIGLPTRLWCFWQDILNFNNPFAK